MQKTYKIAHPIQKPFPMLKQVRFCCGKFPSQNEVEQNVKMGKMGKIGNPRLRHTGAGERGKNGAVN